MRWECSECGSRVERPRRPAVCGACGTAGTILMEAEPSLEYDLEAESFYESWFERGGRDHYRAA